MTDSPTPVLTLNWNDPLGVEVTAAVQRGQADRVRQLLEEHPGLAQGRIVKEGEAAGARTLLHLFADWPGHRRNPRDIVTVLRDAGADLDASCDTERVGETPLHWAASNDDVELVDALLDVGADIDAPGSVVNGLGPLADAAVFGGIRAGRRLVERGAVPNLYQAAALGYLELVAARLVDEPPPDPERITAAFWAACGNGNQAIAQLLLENGAEINWIGWGDKTALDEAHEAGTDLLVRWLVTRGAKTASELRGDDSNEG